MTTVSSVCEKCGAKIPADARQGVCPACQLETGLGLLIHEPAAGGADSGRDDDVGGGESSKVTRQPRIFGDFGDYEVQEEIGRGGQAVVYRARQKSLNRTVALKVIGLGHWATEAHLKRFRREAEAAASLEHPCIVPIYEVGEREGSCYFSMKFVEGGQLDEVTRREPMPPRRAAELIAKVARTVHYAHEHGILHRDIKPGNILLDKSGEPHLTDFGLARLVESESSVTETLDVLGTPSYMAPEQAVGNNAAVSKATDVYGLGAVLYQLLTGHPPFAGGTTYETIRLVLDSEPRHPRAWNPKIDRDLSTICLKSLEKDPKRRYPAAAGLADDLERWLKHEPVRAHRSGVFTRGRKWVRRNPSIAVMAAMLLVLAVPLGVMIWKSETEQLPASNLAAPEKSIAVLPFDNLSKKSESAYFADGVQDEILTDLAKVADLKVISRTSVMHYKSGTARNLREISRQLGVASVVEGSVQRAGNRVRVNAQLVDARTDRHLWAQTYDRDLADVFAIQSEIAQSIASQLQAKISPGEKAIIEEQPTKDLAAYDAYVRAGSLIEDAWDPAKDPKKVLSQAVDLLNSAVKRDPAFALAYCRLAEAHTVFYFQGGDVTPGRLALSKAAIDAAFRLRPDLGEAHLALAHHLYYGYFDYDRARDELAIAQRTLPNNAWLFALACYIDRRQSRWLDAMHNGERAMELDPRNAAIFNGCTLTYDLLRQFKRSRELDERQRAIDPNTIGDYEMRAFYDLHERADARAYRTFLEEQFAKEPASAWWPGEIFYIALCERDFVAAEQALNALARLREDKLRSRGIGEIVFSRVCAQGLLARTKGDAAAAQTAFTAARAQQEQEVLRKEPSDPSGGRALCILGLIDAGLGRKQDALREGRRAIELTPLEKNSFAAADTRYFYAVICAWTGERDAAIKQLQDLINIPIGVTYDDLKLSPYWDSLRGDPRFEKIVEEARQPVALK